MLIAMAGLPGTGKTALAETLARELCAVVLNKDRVRAALFPAPVLDYSAGQDDVSMAAIYCAAAHLLRTMPGTSVLIDGRTFVRPGQLANLVVLGESLSAKLHIIECVCDDDTVRERLERDLEQGTHPARNRTYALYLRLKAQAVAIEVPHLVLDTGKTSLTECVRRCLDYVG
jgi:predicted kinase